MRILFFPANCSPFHGKTLEERPLGGTETAIIRLAEALESLGQEVSVISAYRSVPDMRPRYLPLYNFKEWECDALIVIRSFKAIMQPFRYKKCFYWTGDAYTNFHTFGMGDRRIIDRLDGFLPVSEWHADTVCRSSGFPREKTYVLRNGIRMENFQGSEARQRKRLIYSSSPLRGLSNLPEIFLELKRRHVDVELTVFSGSAVYVPTWPPVNVSEGEAERVFALLRSIPGCHVLGPITQVQLAREFKKSAIWAYPTDFEETSCITAMEAQAGGCVPVTTALAALPETVGEAGVLIPPKAGTGDYFLKYVEACDRLLSDDTFFQSLSQKGIERAQEFDWSKRAQEFLTYLKGHGL